MNNLPITAYDDRNPFCEYNKKYEFASRKSVSKLAEFIESMKEHVAAFITSDNWRPATKSGGNKRKAIKSKARKSDKLQRLARRKNR